MSKDEELKKEEEHPEKRELKEVKAEERIAEEKLEKAEEVVRIEKEEIKELEKEKERLEKEEREHKKMVTIIVNGTPFEWPKGKITFAQVVTLDVPDYAQHPEITYSVKYTKGTNHKPEGILSPGASVEVMEGMSLE